MKSINSENISRKYRERLVKNATRAELKFISILESLKVKFQFQEIIHCEKSFKIVDFLVGTFIIEIDGSSHNKLSQKVSDLKRDAYLSSMGYTVIRIKNEELYNEYDMVLEKVRTLFDNEGYLTTLKSKKGDARKALNPYDKYGTNKIKSNTSNKKVKVSIGDIISINKGKTAWRIMGFDGSGRMQLKSLSGKTAHRSSKRNIHKITDNRIIMIFDKKIPL